MMLAIEVRDDPDHPEGGHALILFRDAPDQGGAVTLMIDPLTEGFDYRGPCRIEVEGRVTSGGFEVAVGPDVVSALPPGIATSLGLAESGLAADVRWPILAQKAAEPRRRVVVAQARRPIVTGASAGTKVQPQRLVSPQPPTIREPPKQDAPKAHALESPSTPSAGVLPSTEPKVDTPLDGRTPSKVSDIDAVVAGNAVVGGTVAPEPDQVRLEVPKTPSAPVRPVPAGWRARSVAAAVIVAFLAGAGGMSAVWLSRPKPVSEPAAMAALPSPYAMLNELSDRSPEGTRVDLRDAKGFRLRGDRAGSPKETDFWHDWATRSLLTGKTNDAAATLSDFATELARGRGSGATGDAPALAAARFLWEMAALASDCTAMDNIATALSRDGQAATDHEAGVWRDRATLCRSATKTAR